MSYCCCKFCKHTSYWVRFLTTIGGSTHLVVMTSSDDLMDMSIFFVFVILRIEVFDKN